jgi:dipeptidyl aminopeptidase/acylaminoacyl peptidase
MGTRLPLRLLYAMAVSLAVLAMLLLILTMASRIADLLAPSSSSQTGDEPRVETTVVENTEVGYDCDGGSAPTEVEGLAGKIVYVCNGDIFRMKLATGEIARLSHEVHDPSFGWSPDGEQIAWADNEFGNLWVTDVGGASPSPQGNESFATFPSWSPDGKTLAFVSAGKPDRLAGLATIPVNSTASRQETVLSQDQDLDGGSVGSTDWSPDGKKILFNVDGPPGAKRGLYTVNTDGTDLTRISWPEMNVRQNGRYWWDPTFSPDGKRIAFVKGRDDRQIYTMNPDGTDAWQATHDAGVYEIQSWSPDGEKILYETLSNGHRELFVVNADGPGRQRLASVPSTEEDWNRIHNVLWLP